MGISGGPYIVRDSSLVLELDAADKNSYSGSGTTWNDLSGNNYSGSLINGPTFSTSYNGTLVFNGSSDYVQMQGSVPISSQTSNITMEVFFYKTGTGTNRIIFYNGISSGPTAGYGFGTASDTTILGVSFAGVGFSVSASGIALNTWYHAVFTNTAAGANTLYINGVSVATSTGTYPAPTVGSTKLSDSSPTNCFQGYIPIARLYHRILSATEVLQNYNAQKSRFNL